jgi:hypothetical protein
MRELTMTFYGTAAAFRDYHTARGRDVTAYDDDAAVEAALLVASEWIDAVYFPPSWPYDKTGGSAQVRRWPTIAVVDKYGDAVASDSVPVRVEYATYEAALRELQSAGALTQDYTPNKYKSVNVQGSVSVVYADRGQAANVQTQFPIIDQILDPLLVGSGMVSALTGAVGRA